MESGFKLDSHMTTDVLMSNSHIHTVTQAKFFPQKRNIKITLNSKEACPPRRIVK